MDSIADRTLSNSFVISESSAVRIIIGPLTGRTFVSDEDAANLLAGAFWSFANWSRRSNCLSCDGFEAEAGSFDGRTPRVSRSEPKSVVTAWPTVENTLLAFRPMNLTVPITTTKTIAKAPIHSAVSQRCPRIARQVALLAPAFPLRPDVRP